MLKSEFINAENKTHIVLSTKGIWTSCFDHLNYVALQEWEAERRRIFMKSLMIKQIKTMKYRSYINAKDKN